MKRWRIICYSLFQAWISDRWMELSLEPETSGWTNRIFFWITHIIQIKANTSCTTDRCNSRNDRALFCPDKMVGPIVFSRVKKRNNLVCLRIQSSNKVVSPLITSTTSQRQIIQIIRTTKRSWNQIDLSINIQALLWLSFKKSDPVYLLNNKLLDDTRIRLSGYFLTETVLIHDRP